MNDVVPQYPWNEGDHLFASALNAAIADGPYLANSGINNVINFGADPTGVANSTTAFRNALATGRNVFAPRGTYRITGQLTLDTTNGAQALRGEGQSTVLAVDTTFDHTVTTGVLVITSGAHNDRQPTVSDLAFRFTQPIDLVKTTIGASAAGTNTIAVNDPTGIVVGMAVVDQTAHAAIPSLTYFTAAAMTTVTAILGDVVTLSANIASPGVGNGDTIQFAAVRSMFKTLAAGGTTTPGGTGVQYPWAIYNNQGQNTLISNVMIINAWDGVYIRGSSFQLEKLDVFAYNIGLDIDQCYNFPSISDYRFYGWGNPANISDALTNTYYDGATVAANFGQCDGVAITNFQTWAGCLNLTAAWSWGQFTNLMLDGDNSNLNVTAQTGGGWVQITNMYTSKSVHSNGTPVLMNAGATFRATLVNFSLVCSAPPYNGVLLQDGILSITDSYFWCGIQSNQSMLTLNGGTLYMADTVLDSPASISRTYILLENDAACYMSDCEFRTQGGSGALGVVCGTGNNVSFYNVVWNGWNTGIPPTNRNNGAVAVAVLDSNSMQAGATSFAQFTTAHYCTGFGSSALVNNATGGTQNTAFGSLAGYGVNTGSNNTFVGATSGYATSGSGIANTTAVGAATGFNLTTGTGNTLLGNYAGTALTTGSGNIIIGAGNANALPYAATMSHTFLLGDSGIAALRATNIDTTAPHLFLDWLPATASFANDAAAATGGVAVGQLYRSGSAVMVRVT